MAPTKTSASSDLPLFSSKRRTAPARPAAAAAAGVGACVAIGDTDGVENRPGLFGPCRSPWSLGVTWWGDRPRRLLCSCYNCGVDQNVLGRQPHPTVLESIGMLNGCGQDA